MTTIFVPYGRSSLTAAIPDRYHTDLISLTPSPAAADPDTAVREALDTLLGSISWGDFSNVQSAAIAINDNNNVKVIVIMCDDFCKKAK